MSELWPQMALGQCLLALNGKQKVQRGWSPQCIPHPVLDGKNWAVLKTTAVQPGSYEFQHNKQLPASLTPKKHLTVEDGDFLMTTTGPRNRCGVVCRVKSTPPNLIFSGKILRFRPNPEIVLPAWLEYVLLSPFYVELLDKLKVGSSDSSVSIGNQQVLEIEIPVPPLLEQRRIISEMEEQLARLDKALAEVQQIDAKVESLVEARRHNLVLGTDVSDISDWQETTLGSVAKWSSGGTPKSGNAKFYGGTIPWCVIGDLTEGEVKRTEKSITELGLSSSSAKIVEPGTVFLAMYGASIGRTGKAALPMATNQAIACAKTTDFMDGDYLLLYLQSQKRAFIGSGKGGAQPNISQQIIKEWPLLLPPLPTQLAIVEQMRDFMQFTVELKKQNTNLGIQIELLRRALLKSAFTRTL